jgi:hypothetical protein
MDNTPGAPLGVPQTHRPQNAYEDDDMYLTPPPHLTQVQGPQAQGLPQSEPMRTSPATQLGDLPDINRGLNVDTVDMLFHAEEQHEDDDYSPPFGVYVAYRNEEQVSASLPVFSSSLSTLAAFLTEPLVVRRLRTFTKDSDTFDSILVPIFNNLRSLLNQWNNIIDSDVRGQCRGNDIRILRPVSAPTRAQQPASHALTTVNPEARQSHGLGTTHRPFREGGVPKQHTVQTTLAFPPAATLPPPTPYATKPTTSYAQAVKTRPQNGVIEIAKALATAMPNAPAASVFEMATRMVPKPPANRVIPRHAPCDASKVITVKPVEGTSVKVFDIPNDRELLSSFSIAYEEAKIDGHIPQSAPDVMFVR